jgi:hypothetical protein
MEMARVEITIEVEASHEGDWQSVIKAGAIILWRSKHKPSAIEAFRVAAKLIGEMPTDFFWAAEHQAPMSRYVKKLEPR